MTHDEQTLELGKLISRAKRAGLLKAEYPDHGIAILLLPPKKPDDPAPDLAASAVPPAAGATPGV